MRLHDNGPPRGDEVVLLVEDEPTVREVTRKLLQRLGYTVLVAESGKEGMKRFREHPTVVDLVITDVVMPGITGTEMAAELRREAPGTRFLFVSGYASRELSQAPGEPPEPFLAKPYTLQELAVAVRDVLDD